MPAGFRRIVITLVAAAALAVTGCATGPAETSTAEKIEVTHQQGTTQVPLKPQKVVVFDYGVVDSLTALNVKIAGLPKSVVPKALEQYKSDDYFDAGTLQEPNFEKIAGESPDLIIITARAAKHYGELSKIAPTIDLSYPAGPQAFTTWRKHVETLGKIFAKEADVTTKLGDIDRAIAATKTKAAAAGTGLIVMTSAGEINAYGSGSRFGLIHDQLGVKPAATVKTEGTHGEAISHEYIAKTNPAHLFVIDRDAAIGETGGKSAAQVLDSDLVKGTTAAKNNDIHYLDSSAWYVIGYGLTNTGAMIAAVDAALS